MQFQSVFEAGNHLMQVVGQHQCSCNRDTAVHTARLLLHLQKLNGKIKLILRDLVVNLPYSGVLCIVWHEKPMIRITLQIDSRARPSVIADALGDYNQFLAACVAHQNNIIVDDLPDKHSPASHT